MPTLLCNNEWIDSADAHVPLEDRGLMFGEGVYEVIRVYNGKPFALEAHAERLRQSLLAIGIQPNGLPETIAEQSLPLLEKNGLTEATLYWQVTRGVSSPRSFEFGEGEPSWFAACYPMNPMQDHGVPTTQVLLVDDRRWADVWVKTTMLLPNTLALNAAKAAGCDHALFVRDGMITEANSANLFAVMDGELWTHPANGQILNGITRQMVVELAGQLGIRVNEQGLYASDLAEVEELFVTGTSTEVTAVVGVQDTEGGQMPIGQEAVQGAGQGQPGPITTQLRQAFVQAVKRACP